VQAGRRHSRAAGEGAWRPRTVSVGVCGLEPAERVQQKVVHVGELLQVQGRPLQAPAKQAHHGLDISQAERKVPGLKRRLCLRHIQRPRAIGVDSVEQLRRERNATR
jgi:hypothetical protein